MKKYLLVPTALLSLFVGSGFTAFAAEFAGPDQASGGNAVVNVSESKRNLYAAGGSVTVNGRTLGDLFAVGGMVSVEGETEKDLSVLGGNIYLNAPVGEDLRVAGGNITVSSSVGGDLLVAGGTVTLNERASVGGDLWVAGGSVIVNSPVKGNVKVAGGNVVINSRVEGRVDAKVGEQLTFGPKAQVIGKTFYQSPKEAVRQQGSQLGEVEFRQVENKGFGNRAKGLLTGAFILKIVAWFLAGWLLLRFWKNRMVVLAQDIRTKPWEALGLGLAVLILTPIVGIILLVSLIGYYVGMVTLVGYAALLVVVNLLSALVLGYWILTYLNKTSEPAPAWQIALLGVVVWQLLGLIPIVGWLVVAVIFLIVLGSSAKFVKRKIVEQ